MSTNCWIFLFPINTTAAHPDKTALSVLIVSFKNYTFFFASDVSFSFRWASSFHKAFPLLLIFMVSVSFIEAHKSPTSCISCAFRSVHSPYTKISRNREFQPASNRLQNLRRIFTVSPRHSHFLLPYWPSEAFIGLFWNIAGFHMNFFIWHYESYSPQLISVEFLPSEFIELRLDTVVWRHSCVLCAFE